MIQKVIQSYYNLLQAQQLYEVAEKNLEMSEDQVSLVEKQFELGVVKKTDLLKANVAQGQARVEALNKKLIMKIAEEFYLMIWVCKTLDKELQL